MIASGVKDAFAIEVCARKLYLIRLVMMQPTVP
jgi:hypothetical protein